MNLTSNWARMRRAAAALALLPGCASGAAQTADAPPIAGDSATVDQNTAFRPSQALAKEKPLIPGVPQTDHLRAERVDVYPLKVAAFQRVEINATSDDLDMILQLYNGNDELVGENDDGGQNKNAKLFFQTFRDRDPRAGTYYVVARTLTPEQGVYDISVLMRDAPPAPSFVTLDPGKAVTGLLSDASPVQGVEGQPYAAYRIDVKAGERVRLKLDSEDFDAKLELRQSDEVIASDDDGGVGINAMITKTIANNGTLEVRAIAGSGKRGSYTLSLTIVPLPAAEPLVTDIKIGQAVPLGEVGDSSALIAQLDGWSRQVNVPGMEVNPRLRLAYPRLRLTSGCSVSSARRPYRLYRLHGVAGDTATISWTTDAGRCGLIVEIGVDSPAGFATVHRWSEGEAATLRFDSEGDLMLRVSIEPDQNAKFQLRVSDATRPVP